MPKAPYAKDVHGQAIKPDGTYQASTGTGPIVKMSTPIGPIDMPDLVRRGLIAEAKPNWDPDDPESNWACMGGYRKFTPERRAIFLAKLEETGRTMLSARFAGVDRSTIQRHVESDPAFAAACKEAEGMYHEMCAASITAQARAGMVDERWDKEGNILSRRVTYETRLREKLLDRADPSYQTTSKQELAVVGGAVVVPAPTDSVESWDDVVRRHTGQTVAVIAPDPEAGGRALGEGRVIKRPVLEAKGESVSDVGAGSPAVGSDVSQAERLADSIGSDTSAGPEIGLIDRSELPAER